ncbi:MAG: protein kinase [Deltaproteobacteria bacterium]|nr:protein kinase [Deltaproteobacteria bacterium]
MLPEVDGGAATHPSEPPPPLASSDGSDGGILRAPDRELTSGESVGEYVIEAKVGEGSFGIVYRAKHPLIGKRVAIKVLAGSYSADPQVSARFLSEAQAVNRIAHPNIVDIFSFGRLQDGRLYYVMEYLDGVSLDRRLSERGRLSLSEAATILRPIARALDAAAARGVAHRDLKPANVMLGTTADGEVVPKLVDFGIAKILGADRPALEHTATGSPIGTPYYMSPEQCRAEPVDPRTDVYAFGVMLYQALTGELPFKGPSFLDIMMKHVERDPLPPSKIRAALGRDVDRLVLALMAKRPEDRPPRLGPVVEELAKLAIRSVDLESSIPPEEITAPFRKPGGAAPKLAVGVVLLGGVAAWVFLGSKPDRSEATPEDASAPVVDTASVSAVIVEPRLTHTPTPAAELVRPGLERPERVRLEVSGTPAKMRVWSGKLELGTVPGVLLLAKSDDPLVLVFRAKGYQPRTLSFTPSRDGRLTIRLPRAGTKSKKARTNADEIEDVNWGR